MKVYLSELAESKLLSLSEYLIEKWNRRTRDKFFVKLTNKINQISSQPYSCPKSEKFKGLYKCVVTNQTTLYYRFQSDEIEIITVFDTRQDPGKLKKDL